MVIVINYKHSQASLHTVLSGYTHKLLLVHSGPPLPSYKSPILLMILFVCMYMLLPEEYAPW